jgi:hypothetical protein
MILAFYLHIYFLMAISFLEVNKYLMSCSIVSPLSLQHLKNVKQFITSRYIDILNNIQYY